MAKSEPANLSADKLPIKLMQDRLLVHVDTPEGERRSAGGIVIPATAELSRRLQWGEVTAAGPLARNIEVGDHVLFTPEDLYEVEVQGASYLLLRERDVHAVAAPRLEEEPNTGLYL